MAREPFNDIWANNPASDQFEEPPSSAFKTGWEGGADKNPPQAKWENWWHNRVDNALQDLERNGAMEWLSDVPYAPCALARGSDGAVYIAVQDNEGFDPTIDDGSNWLSLTDFIKSVFNASGAAPVYAVRAWANFDGIGGALIRSSGNIQSISKISDGVYEVLFSTPMQDRFYSVSGSCSTISASGAGSFQDSFNSFDYMNTGFKIQSWGAEDGTQDMEIINFQVVR